jgi:hypothetical protein
MAVPTPLSLASIIIGFISFTFTLTILIGIYKDLISTLRKADKQMPIILGNLRQELIFERALISHKLDYGDEFNVFPRKLRYMRTGPSGKREKGGLRQQYARLLEVTISDLWIEFKRLERPFLIRSGFRAEEVQRGGYWSSDDLQEKPSRRGRKRSRRGALPSDADLGRAEAGVRAQTSQYYNTDFAHRFIWWQSKDAVDRLANQVQRVQIRRMERDLYETDELVKRVCRREGGGDGRYNGGGGGGGSGSSSSSDDGGRKTAARSRVVSRAGSVRNVRIPSRRGSAASGNFREVEERSVVRRTATSPDRVRQSEMEASNTGRRRERREGPRTEYELLRPGSFIIERVERPRSTYGNDREKRGIDRTVSYSRERGRDR